MPRRMESLFVAGPAGKLEALLEEPEDAAPIGAALVCHPHPQHGGTMHNKVVYRIARGLRSAGFAVLRFNYRGVNLSEGEYGHGAGEVEDARAVLSVLRGRYPELPFTLAGFSFGSRIVLQLCSEEPERIIAVGFPTVYRDTAYLRECLVPRVFIQSANDEFGPLGELEPLVAALSGPKRLITIPAQDHFFAGALELLEQAVRQIPLPPSAP